VHQLRVLKVQALCAETDVMAIRATATMDKVFFMVCEFRCFAVAKIREKVESCELKVESWEKMCTFAVSKNALLWYHSSSL
jgi:hypothetical protein